MLQTVIMNVSDVSQPQPQLGRPALHLWRKNYSRGRKRGVTFLSDLNINILPELLGETLSLCLRNITAVTEKTHISVKCVYAGMTERMLIIVFSPLHNEIFSRQNKHSRFKPFEIHVNTQPDKMRLLW